MVKRLTSLVLAVFLLLIYVNVGTAKVGAAEKVDDSRTIAIVFDNSGSMYVSSGKAHEAWCRATYAMEVFAAMLNKGDTLLIYPMWEIEVNGKKYTMENPMKITDPKQSSDIREIYTPYAQGTPIESIDSAISGLDNINTGKKYLVVLTDGDSFKRGSQDYKGNSAKPLLDEIVQNNAGPDMTIMYLGIGKDAVMPNTPESDYFGKKHAVNSEDVLSSLTEMCNQIFGRDTLPKKYISGKSVNFDISMSKLIVFVQGEKISDLKIVDKNGRKLKIVSETSTKFSTKGYGKWNGKFVEPLPDKSLQGMMITSEDCAAGDYTIEYSGKATSVEVYYEPDADLDFVFTDADGNTVNPDALYEGDYKVSFGMKDAKTGELISSELLGTPKYRGTYSINGESTPISHDGDSSYESVTLKMDDTFDANLTVTYLSGYTITKDSSDFGWPFGGIKVAAKPAGNLKLDISGGDDFYSLQDLDKGEPYIAKIYYEGSQLVGKELEKVVLEWNPDTSNAEIKKEFADDHYKLWLEHKDALNPQDTKCGKCTVTIFASYREEGSDNSRAQKSLTYMIRDDFTPLRLDLYAPDSYITIKDLDDSRAIVAEFTIKGKKLDPADFDALKLKVDCSGIKHTITPDKEKSAYLIKLLDTENISEGDYLIHVTAEYTDHIGRVTQLEDSLSVTLSHIPLWLRWLIWIVALILIALLIWLWLRTPVLPKVIDLDENTIRVSIEGEVQRTLSATVDYPKKGKKRTITIEASPGALNNVYVSATLVPAKDSYRYLRSNRRRAMVIIDSVDMGRDVNNVTLGNVRIIKDGKNGFVFKPAVKDDFEFTASRINFSGAKSINGRLTDFSITGNIVFKDRK